MPLPEEPRSGADGRAHLVALSGLTGIAVVLRLLYLDQPIRYDEAYTYTNTVAHGLRHALSQYQAPNNHVFHSVLVRLSVGLFGNDPWAIRLPAFVAGVLLVPASYVAGRALYGRRAALFAAALVASLGELVMFSTDARGYTMVSLAFVVLIAIASRLKRDRDPRAWAAFTGVAALGLFTIPTMLYPVGGVALWLAASAAVGDTRSHPTRILRDLALSLAAAAVLTVLLYTPVLLGTGLRSLVANPYVTPDSAQRFLSGLPWVPRRLWQEWMLGVPSWAAVAVAVGACLGIIFHRRVAADRVPLWLAVLVWSGALLLVTRRIPGVRIWLFLLPLAALVTGAGLALAFDVLARRLKLGRELMAAALPVALALGVAEHAVRTDAVRTDVGHVLRDGPEIAGYLQATLGPGDKVLTDIPSDAPLEYYLDRRKVPRSFLAWNSRRSTSRARLAGSERLIVVVNPQTWQTLERVLKANRVAAEDVEEASAPRRFRNGAVLHVLRWRSGHDAVPAVR